MNLDGYVDVAQRLRLMFDRFPELRLVETPPEIVVVDGKTFVSVTVTAWRDPDDPVPAVATCWEPFPGKTPYTRDSEMMNAATSALGRVANLLMPIGKSLASLEEVLNRRMDGGPRPRDLEETAPPMAGPEEEIPPPDDPYPPVIRPEALGTAGQRPQLASEAQWKAIRAIAKKRNVDPPTGNLSKRDASEWIEAHG